MMPIENIFIFVSDSLRWDALPKRIAKQGTVFKTVTQSLYSAPSFATLSTGLYPQEHGVSEWHNQIAQSVQSIYDLPNTDSGFYQTGDPETEGIFSVLNQSEARPLSSLSPPFVYLERDTQAHPPLGEHTSVENYYRDRAKDWNRVKAEYKQGVQESLSVFEQRLDELKDRGLLDSTLIVLTSDHGELFGEYGDVGHGAPAVPEIAYVPTVFMHPSLDSADFYVDSETEIVEHVDVVTTALAAANHHKTTSGTNILSTTRPRPWGYNRHETHRRGKDFYTSDSLWWPNGGYTFLRNSRHLRGIYALYRLLKGAERHAIQWNVHRLANTYLRSSHQYGSVPVSKAEAYRLADRFVETLNSVESESTEISSATENRLKELGYLDT